MPKSTPSVAAPREEGSSLRSRVQERLMAYHGTIQTVLTRYKSSNALSDAAEAAEHYKLESIVLIGSVIEERRTTLKGTMEDEKLERCTPEELLLSRPDPEVPDKLKVLYTETMGAEPRLSQNARILDPFACAEALLRATLERLPKDDDIPTLPSTADFAVE